MKMRIDIEQMFGTGALVQSTFEDDVDAEGTMVALYVDPLIEENIAPIDSMSGLIVFRQPTVLSLAYTVEAVED